MPFYIIVFYPSLKLSPSLFCRFDGTSLAGRRGLTKTLLKKASFLMVMRFLWIRSGNFCLSGQAALLQIFPLSRLSAEVISVVCCLTGRGVLTGPYIRLASTSRTPWVSLMQKVSSSTWRLLGKKAILVHLSFASSLWVPIPLEQLRISLNERPLVRQRDVFFIYRRNIIVHIIRQMEK